MSSDKILIALQASIGRVRTTVSKESGRPEGGAKDQTGHVTMHCLMLVLTYMFEKEFGPSFLIFCNLDKNL